MAMRLLRHLFTDHVAARRAFPAATLKAIGAAIGRDELRHDGELRFVIEASMPFRRVLRKQPARGRALELFSQLKVWDTEHNSGVLIYVLLADRHVEIVADRGIHAKVADGTWDGVCAAMQQAFAAGQFEAGAIAGVDAISDLLALHFPRAADKANELPDEPVML
jgi:uncharacterized membrane protein